MTIKQRLFSTSLVLSLMLFLGRLAGFMREMQLGAVLGVTRDADFAVIMLTTPDLLVNLLLAGGLGAALVPEFSRLDPGGRTRAFVSISCLVGCAFGAIAIFVAVFPSILMWILAPGYANVPLSEYSDIFAITAVAIPFAGLTGVTAAMLNAEQKFFIAGAGTLIFNVTIVFALAFWFGQQQELRVLATAIALASVLRYVSQFVACLPGLSLAPTQITPTRFPQLFLRFVQALGASTLVLFIPVILRAVISLSGAGNIAAYNFATKLVELPLGIAITTISTVALPAISKAVAVGNYAGERQLFSDGVQRSLTLSLCIAIPCFFFSDVLVSLVFGRGRMETKDLELISDIARLGFLTLPSIAVSSMTSALLNARGEMGLLLRMAIVATVLVPIAALPGIVTNDARLSLVALPIFHFVFAVLLARASRHPFFADWRWTITCLIQPTLAGIMGTAIFAPVWMLTDMHSALLGSALACGAILLSLTFASVRSKR